MAGEDQKLTDEYRMLARALWDFTGERLKFTSQIHADYGKWLLVTITSSHLAAIYIVSQPSVPDNVRLSESSYWPFVLGLSLALIAGLVTWINWGIFVGIYTEWMKVGFLVDPGKMPQDVNKRTSWALKLTFLAPIILGLGSAICIPYGLHNAFNQKPPAHNITQVQSTHQQPPPAP